MNKEISPRYPFALVLLLPLLLISDHPFAGESSEPGPGPVPEVQAMEIARPVAPIFQQGLDGPALIPNHPPIDEIQPIPMPEPAPSWDFDSLSPGSPVLHDAETGETIVLPGEDGPPGDAEEEWMRGGGYDGADGGNQAVEPSSVFNDMVQILNTEDHPWRMNCKILMRFEDAGGDDQWYVGSASMLDAETVLTAGHCVFSQDHGWAHEIWVYPGWDGNGTIPWDTTIHPYGFGHGTYFASWTTWTEDGNHDGDVGLISITRAVGMLTGWFGWAYGGSCSWHTGTTYNNASFPAEDCGEPGLHNGMDMYYWWGNFDSCPGNQLQIDTSGGCYNAGWGGMSGSGAYYIDGPSRYVHAISSTSNRTTIARYCRQWEAWVNYMVGTFIPGSRGASFDLQALDCNAEPTLIEAGGTTTLLNHLASNPTDGSASGTWWFEVYLSTNDNISTADTLLSTQTYSWDFAAMSSVRLNMVQVTIPADAPPGNYWIGVIYDGATDGDSSNNDTDGWDATPITVYCPSQATPTGVDASDGTYCDRVAVTWNPAAGASEYLVYRNGSPLSPWQTGTSYDDYAVADGVVYSYQVKARNACGDESPLSSSNTGYLCERPDNDDCANSLPAYDGTTPFSNINATTDGPDEPERCDFFSDTQIDSDVWFHHTALWTGEVTVSLCGSDYDTKLAVYEGPACPTVQSAIACNDDYCALQSELTFFATSGNQYLIRIGGFNGAQGSGTMTISTDPSAIGACQGIDDENVLMVNGDNGTGSGHVVHVDESGPISLSIVKPSGGGNGKFCVHMNVGAPTVDTIATLPAGLGPFCFELFLGHGATPVCVWNNLGKTNRIGSSKYFGTSIPDPARAPVTFQSLPSGDAANLPVGSVVTLQGLILNPAASAEKPGSVTNAIVMVVL